jgi:hypothetical protein
MLKKGQSTPGTMLCSWCSVLLFVREFNKINNTSLPFTCLGTAKYVEHSGSKPMSIVWKLDHPIPPGLMKQANKAISG